MFVATCFRAIHISSFISGDKSFNGLIFDDDFLLQYLRCRKFNAKRSFTQLKAFVSLRKSYKKIFKDFHFDNIAITTQKKIVTFLPYRCQDGCAILLVKLGKSMSIFTFFIQNLFLYLKSQKNFFLFFSNKFYIVFILLNEDFLVI